MLFNQAFWLMVVAICVRRYGILEMGNKDEVLVW